MVPQRIALITFLAVASFIAFTFLWVIRSAGTSQHLNPAALSKLRKRFAITCAVILCAALGLTLPKLPYARNGDVPEKVIFVAAKQFAFGLAETAITSEQQWETASQGPAVKVPARSLVEFRVTSLDVNHGFGIYTPDGTLLAQTQAMPGYVSRLRVRLEQPGRYPILCLELCGMEHHSMRGVFDVVASQKEDSNAPSYR